MRIRAIAVVTALFGVILLSGCGPGNQTTTEPINVGAIVPLTGDGSDFGPGMAEAARIAVDEVNAAGGPIGRHFKLYVEDDATSPDQGVRAAHKLIDVNHVSAIVGTWSTAVTKAVFPLTLDANILEMNVSGAPQVSTLQPPGQHTIFTVNATDTDLSKIVAAALRKQGPSRVTIMANNDEATSTFAKVFSDAFRAEGGSVIKTIIYPSDQKSYTTEVAQALKTKPDAYVLACFTPDGAQILKEAFQAGSNGNWVVPAWCLNDQLVGLVGPNVVQGDIAFDLIPVADAAAYKRLAGTYLAKTGKDLFNNVYAAHVYDSIHLLALAIEKAQTLKPLELGKALIVISNPPGQDVSSYQEGAALLKQGKAVHYQGASGPIEFNQTGDMSPYVGLFSIDNGKPVLKLTLSQRS